MINSFGTGKPTEADGERGSGRKRQQLFGLFGRRRLSSPAWRLASAAKPHRSRSQQQQNPAAFFFLCCCFCGCRLSAAAAGSHPTDDGKIHRLVQQNGRRWFCWSDSSSPTAESTAHGTFK